MRQNDWDNARLVILAAECGWSDPRTFASNQRFAYCTGNFAMALRYCDNKHDIAIAITINKITLKIEIVPAFKYRNHEKAIRKA